MLPTRDWEAWSQGTFRPFGTLCRRVWSATWLSLCKPSMIDFGNPSISYLNEVSKRKIISLPHPTTRSRHLDTYRTPNSLPLHQETLFDDFSSFASKVVEAGSIWSKAHTTWRCCYRGWKLCPEMQRPENIERKKILRRVSWVSESDGFSKVSTTYLATWFAHITFAKTAAPSFAVISVLVSLRIFCQVRWIRMEMTSCCSCAILKEGLTFAKLHCVWLFVRHDRSQPCWLLFGFFSAFAPPEEPWEDGRVPELYEPGLRLSLGATMHRFSGQDIWNLVSQVSVTSWGNLM